jgi:hypothetical protein
VITVTKLRQEADRCFDFVHTTADLRLQDQARARGFQCLREADALERQDIERVLRAMAGVPSGRMSPVQNAALAQLARVEAQIVAIEAEHPPVPSARANILAALRRKKSELEQACGHFARATARR